MSFFNPFVSETIDLSEYAKKEDLVGQKTANGGEIFNDYENNIAANNAHAEGNRTRASGNYSHAEGRNTTASGNCSHAEGDLNAALGNCSHAEGNGTTASGPGSHAEGFITKASSPFSHAEGNRTTASGDYSHTEGYGTIASRPGSHAEGYYTKASSNHQHVQGKYNVEDTNGKYSFIIGNGTSDTARSNAFAIDWNGLIYTNNNENGYDLSTFLTVEDGVGQKTTDGGEIFNDYGNNIATTNSHAEGSNTKAYGNYSHSEGHQTNAYGNGSHAEGDTTTAGTRTKNDDGTITYGGVCSHAEGQYTTASDECSHAEGCATRASAFSAHAEGSGATASGGVSHAEGGGTAASGDYSHAEGNGTTASGYCSHAEGFITKASSDYQHVQGKYNVEDTNGKYAFIIGNGTSNSERSNAFAIGWDGLIYLNNSSTGIDLTSLTSGSDGREIELQTTETMIQWRYVGDEAWTDLIALSSLKGPQGLKGDTGVGIESITFKNSSSGAGAAQPGAIDTYTITYTDGSHTEFQIKNGEDGTPAVIDTVMSDTSENTVQNKVIKSYIDSTAGDINSILSTEIDSVNEDLNNLQGRIENINTAVDGVKEDLSALEQDINPFFNFSESPETITTLIKNNSDGQWIVNSASPEYVVFLERSGTYAKARYFDISADKNVLRYDITVRNNGDLNNYFIVDENYKILVTGEKGKRGEYYSYSLSDIPAGAKYILLNSLSVDYGYEFAKRINSVKTAKNFVTKQEINMEIVVTVKKDGTGDFSRIRDAVESIKDANSENKPYVIEVYPGTYNVFEDYTDAEILSAGTEHYTDSSFVGIKLTDGISLRGVGAKEDIVIHGEVSTDYEQALRNNLSALNMQGTNFIENVTVTAKNIRYAVHDDFTAVYAERNVKNCNFYGEKLTSGTAGISYGMGQRPNHYAVFENCDFGVSFLWHSGNEQNNPNPSEITLINCRAIYCRLHNYNQFVTNRVHLNNCEFDDVSISETDTNAGTQHMITVDGVGTENCMISCKPGLIYSFGGVSVFKKSIYETHSLGDVVKLDADLYWQGAISRTSNRHIAYGIVVGISKEKTYVQRSGFVSSTILGITGLAVGDFITIDTNGKCVSGGTEDNAIGVVKRVKSDVAYIKLLI